MSAQMEESQQSALGRKDGPNEKAAKKRKQRALFSCAECRRLKLKCDRQVPCANCIRRSCPELCPGGSKTTSGSGTEAAELRARVQALESVLHERGLGIPSDNRTTLPTHEQPDEMSRRDPSHSPQSRESHSRESQSRDKRPRLSAPAQQPASDRPSNGHAEAQRPTSLPQHTPSPSSVRQASLPPNPRPMPDPSPNRVHFDYHLPGDTTERTDWTHGLSSAADRPGALSDEQSHGTLVLSEGGRSKYLGPTAASEWLKEQETNEVLESPVTSRLPSPQRLNHFERPGMSHSPFETSTTGRSYRNPPLNDVPFPLDSILKMPSTAYLLSRLPHRGEANILIDSYYRYFAWNYNVAPREGFQPIYDRIYQQASDDAPNPVSPQELALAFIILAMGALQNLELSPDDALAHEFMLLAKTCLHKGNFMVQNTIAGVQTLHIMAHYHLETERGRNGDSAWPLWGLAMRIIQAMGLHRDGQRWDLPVAAVEERRRVFWECHTADIFQANCFSRPNTIRNDHFDTAYPNDNEGSPGSKGFRRMKFELSNISAAVLDHSLKIQAPAYSTVTLLHERLLAFEKEVPYELRCRPALIALSSVYPDPQAAASDSPEISKWDLTGTFQRCTLALNITEAIIFLHRPYFVKALHLNGDDPTGTPYALSFLTVVERSNVILQIVSTLRNNYPHVSSRHWNLWYHAFNAAVCMGTLLLRSPRNLLNFLALAHIDATIGLYTSAIQIRSSPRLVRNLQWLLQLKQRAVERIEKMPSTGPVAELPVRPNERDEDMEMMGWRTRLIQRAEQGTQTAKTILSTPTPSNPTPSPHAILTETINQALQEHFTVSDTQLYDPRTAVLPAGDSSTDIMLHQFWDPMLLQENDRNQGGDSGFNWRDWDLGLQASTSNSMDP